MNKSPINNGKDIKKPKTHNINTPFGKIKTLKSNIYDINKITYFVPKNNNRWYLEFKRNFKEIPSFSVKKTTRPKLINGSWANIKIVFYDVIGASTTQAIVEGFRNSWQINNTNTTQPIIEYNLYMLDPTGAPIESWKIKGKVINANFGKLNYKKSKLSKVKLIIEPISVILLY